MAAAESTSIDGAALDRLSHRSPKKYWTLLSVQESETGCPVESKRTTGSVCNVGNSLATRPPPEEEAMMAMPSRAWEMYDQRVWPELISKATIVWSSQT